jgi:hypothetical protein
VQETVKEQIQNNDRAHQRSTATGKGASKTSGILKGWGFHFSIIAAKDFFDFHCPALSTKRVPAVGCCW